MESIGQIFSADNKVPILVSIILVIVGVLFILNRLLREYWETRKFQFQFTMLILTLIAGVMIIVVLPFSDTLRGQLLTLLGVLFSASIAFSSTTFIGNILAGLMLKVIKNIKLGDFVTVSDVTGRATEMSLLHVEVQTEQSDLVTIPNILMVTQPVKVVRSTGTIISVDVSLGYDIERSNISELLCLAVEDAGLSDGFVQIRELGDFSVTYRAAGRIKDTLSLLSVKSSLYGYVLDRLHGARIEIVSPNFMNTRTVQDVHVIPKKSNHSVVEKSDGNVEKIIFEKAEKASAITNITSELHKLSVALENKEEPLADAERESTESKVEQLKVELKIKKELLDEDDVASEEAATLASSDKDK
ncbi:MscS Mechanosensitive ion channel family protein [Oleispira antarctica RB-8]|uniref:Small-conductance mechanosensitive channel n=1 Tax=Oleispira antarctica RB-8 TaxID=698738 RepID=R4YS85_OLEAN|nr:MscS Mechanosensitive ion channel family protein [Oleispira antarctica RB-8]